MKFYNENIILKPETCLLFLNKCSLLPFDLGRFPTLNITLVGIYDGKQDGT